MSNGTDQADSIAGDETDTTTTAATINESLGDNLLGSSYLKGDQHHDLPIKAP